MPSKLNSGRGRVSAWFSWHRLGVCLTLLIASWPLHTAAEVSSLSFVQADYASVREAVIEAIEGEGLVVGHVMAFNDMLVRTGPGIGKGASPFVQAEIIQFCSSQIAWQLIEEAPGQIALCPLSIALSERRQPKGLIVISWRTPTTSTPGQEQAGALLRRLQQRIQREVR